MKYLLVLFVVVLVLWLMLRSRGGAAPRPPGERRGRGGAKTEEIVACVHCGLHLPRHDALVDANGRPYCSDAHRLAGPR